MARRIDPRIEHRRVRFLIIADIAGHDCQSVVQRRRGDDEIRLREGMADFAAVFDQETPLEHDVLGDREDTLLEHWAHLVRQPIIEFSATTGVRE